MLGGSPPWGASAPPRPRPPNPPPPARVPFGRFAPSTLANGCAFRGYAPPFNPPASWARCRSPSPHFSACIGLAGHWHSTWACAHANLAHRTLALLATLALRTRKATPGLHGSAFGLRFTFAPCAPPCSPRTLGTCLGSPRIVHGFPSDCTLRQPRCRGVGGTPRQQRVPAPYGRPPRHALFSLPLEAAYFSRYAFARNWAASRFAPLRRGPNFPAYGSPASLRSRPPYGRATGTAVFGLRPQAFLSATRGQPSAKGARAAYGVTACGTAAAGATPSARLPYGRPATGVVGAWPGAGQRAQSGGALRCRSPARFAPAGQPPATFCPHFAPARRRPARTRPLRVRCAPFPRAVLLRTADNIGRCVSKKNRYAVDFRSRPPRNRLFFRHSRPTDVVGLRQPHGVRLALVYRFAIVGLFVFDGLPIKIIPR